MAKKKFVGNKGTTAPAAAPTIVVAHGLPGAPTAVIVQGHETGATDVFVDTVGAADFTIHFTKAVGNESFDWLALI